ncbi:MAG TPA: head GIN domain-containing protein [Balneolaceae bacterium]|nr:head GIN domain-containing protein [Balneolaceae bacterium]
MYRVILGFSISLFALAGCVSFGPVSQKSIKGNGDIISQTREVGDFTELRVTGARSTIVYGDRNGPIRITGDSNILEHTSSYVENGTLVITTASNASLSPTQRVEIEVPSTSLDYIRVSGSNRINIKNIDRSSFTIRGSGSTTIEADGYADDLQVRMSGSSRIDASGLIAETVAIRTSGSSKAEIYASERLKSRSSGSSRIMVHGHPKKITNQSSGSSFLRSVR